MQRHRSNDKSQQMCFCQGWNAAWIRFTVTQTFNRIAHNSKRGPQMRCFLFYCTQLFDLFVLTVVFKPKVCGRPRDWEFQKESTAPFPTSSPATFKSGLGFQGFTPTLHWICIFIFPFKTVSASWVGAWVSQLFNHGLGCSSRSENACWKNMEALKTKMDLACGC